MALKDLDDLVIEEKPLDVYALPMWKKKDKAHALIGLSLSDELLENVRDVDSAKVMSRTIKDVFERQTLLNKLSAR